VSETESDKKIVPVQVKTLREELQELRTELSRFTVILAQQQEMIGLLRQQVTDILEQVRELQQGGK